jgi:DNA-binding transcriptional LysR family regulator
VSARDLRGEPFIWIPRAALPEPFRRSWEGLGARGFAPNVVVEARSSASRLGLVAAGMGLTFVLESSRLIVPRRVVLRPVSDVQLTVQSVLAWRAQDETAPVVQSLREAALALAAVRRRTSGRRARGADPRG